MKYLLMSLLAALLPLSAQSDSNAAAEKGWMGTWDMPVKYREITIVDTQAWVPEEF